MIVPITPEQREAIAGRTVVASVSGGKDSAALSLWLTENGIEHLRVFADTGWEADETYQYLRGPLAAKLGPIVEVRGERQMVELIRHKGMFPSRVRRFCTQELKVYPISNYLAGLGVPVVNAVGVRAAESEKRAKMAGWEWQTWRGEEAVWPIWRPLLLWTEADVIEIHRRHGLAPNPLYLAGAGRVGCWPCINSVKAEIALLSRRDPARIALITDLEAELTAAAAAQAAAAGEQLKLQRTWFHKKKRKRGARSVDDERSWKPWPIHDVVAWSRTRRGGHYLMLDLPQPDEDLGCMKWGLCESPSGVSEAA